MRKLKKKLSNLLQGLMKWVFVPGRNILVMILIILAICVLVTVVGGSILGILFGLPALFLYVAFNWTVPAFGGPSITYRTAIGLTILLCILVGIFSALRK